MPGEEPMTVDESTRTRLLAALERHARHEMRWGGDVVHQIQPTSVQHLRVWSAQLDTLVEERYLRRVTRSAAPDAVEHPATTTVELDPWSLEVEVPQDFQDGTHEVDVAGTEHVKTCPLCHGETKVRCPECGGEGMHGYRRPCLTCRGTALAKCDACEGQGRLVELRVVEVLRRHDARRHVDRETSVPAEALEKATRDELLHLDVPRIDVAIYAATTAAYRGRGPSADPEFDEAVRGMIVAAEVSAPARVVRQRLIVRHVPVAQVDYDWRGDPGKLWLVGTEERVFGEDMPLQRAYVSRAVSAAREKFGGLLGRGLMGKFGKK